MAHPHPLAEVIAPNVQSWRFQTTEREGEPQHVDGVLSRRLTQAGLAQRMRRVGLPWTEATVAAVELGRREPSVLELAALCGIFGVGVDQLLHATGRGERIATPGGVPQDPFDIVEALTNGSPLSDGNPARGWSPKLVDEVTRKVASRAGLDPKSLDAAARKRYGVSLVEERERRLDADGAESGASPRSIQARRGHIMRQLLGELDAEVKTDGR
jgi:transcriptional regulator with XRE-family HTH domain